MYSERYDKVYINLGICVKIPILWDHLYITELRYCLIPVFGSYLVPNIEFYKLWAILGCKKIF